MKLSECKETLREYTGPALAEYGFEFAKTPAYNCAFRKYDALGFDVCYYNYEASYGGMQGYFAAGRTFNAVETALLDIQKTVRFGCPYKKVYPIFSFDPYSLNGRRGDRNSIFDESYTKEDLVEVSRRAIDFYVTRGRAILEKYQDLREFDRLINTNRYWEKPYLQEMDMGSDFNIIRMICAKLTGNPRYEEIIKKSYDEEIVEINEKKDDPRYAAGGVNCYVVYTMDDLTKPIPFTAHYLKDVKPLFDSYEK